VPIGRSAFPGGGLCRTNPIRRATPGGTRPAGQGATGACPPSQEPTMRNEANSLRGRGRPLSRPKGPGDATRHWGDCAKRSQFPAAPGGARPRGRGCRMNKANSRHCRAGRSPGDEGRGARVQNEANLARPHRVATDEECETNRTCPAGPGAPFSPLLPFRALTLMGFGIA
jgi:hypothetical protein